MITLAGNIHSMLELTALGILTCSVEVHPSNSDFWKTIEDDINTCKTFKLEQIGTFENIKKARKIYKNFGADPLRYRLSADSLIRRIIKGNELYQVNNVIDILNYISFTTGISIGGYDMDKTQGPYSLGRGNSIEQYEGIGRGLININNLPVLSDSVGAFGSPTSDSVRTMITDKSKHYMMVFFFIDEKKDFNSLLDKTKDLLNEYCFATDFKQYIVQ